MVLDGYLHPRSSMNVPLRILLAEDNPDDVFLLRLAFKRADVAFPFETLWDGSAVIDFLSGTGPYAGRTLAEADVLLLDLNMPRRSGLDVLEWIRRQPQWKTLIVHVLSASLRDEDVQRAYELGANSYLVKPSRIDDLVTLISNLHAWHRWVVPARRPSLADGDNTTGSGGLP